VSVRGLFYELEARDRASPFFTIVLVECIPNGCDVLSKRFANSGILKCESAIFASPTVKILFFFPNYE
jgi:hypothetical protein